MQGPRSVLKVSGVVSIEPVTSKVPARSYIYLMLGPTGAGKSSFIEALGGHSPSLSISKDQLSGYTQCMTAYKLVNVFCVLDEEYPVYLIDTPGFCDPRASAFDIVETSRRFLKDNEIPFVNSILFLTPITDNRLTGTKRRTIEMLRTLHKPTAKLDSIIFVTTMWDTLHNERIRRRAESNFEELRDGVLQEFISDGASVAAFKNTQISALQILDAFTSLSSAVVQHSAMLFQQLYEDLQERMRQAVAQKQIIECDLDNHDTQENPDLKHILETKLKENKEILTSLVRRFSLIEQPPPGYDSIHQHLHRVLGAMDREEPTKGLQIRTYSAPQETYPRIWKHSFRCRLVMKFISMFKKV